MEVRSYTPADAPALYQIVQRAIQEGAAGHYDADQRDAWAARFTGPDALALALEPQDTVVGLQEGQVRGFMARKAGHLDLAFVAPEAMGTGLAAALHDVLVNRAVAEGQGRMTTHASHLARSFFARRGWQHDAAQTVHLGPVALGNHRMHLPL